MANEMMMNNANALKANAQTQALMQRASQEVQAAVFMAKQFPRDEDLAYNRIMQATTRRKLAEGAFYEYAKGGTNIFGPSIRLAEVIAQNWGNLETGVKEIERRDGVINVCEMKYAEGSFAISPKYETDLRNKLNAFRLETGTKDALHLTLVVSGEFARNANADIVISFVVGEELFA